MEEGREAEAENGEHAGASRRRIEVRVAGRRDWQQEWVAGAVSAVSAGERRRRRGCSRRCPGSYSGSGGRSSSQMCIVINAMHNAFDNNADRSKQLMNLVRDCEDSGNRMFML